jgi:exopolysaccharide production protein ExoQ
MPEIATVVCVAGIFWLFVLDRDRTARTSKALWIPVAWLLVAGSRPVSVWLQIAPPTATDTYVEGSPLDRAVFTALLVAGLIVLVRRRRLVVTVLHRNWPILLLFSYCAVSVLWSDYPDVSFKRWTKALGDLVMVLVILTDPEPIAAIKRFLARTGFLLVPLSILLIKYYPDLGRGYSRWNWTPVLTGVATDKNMLGLICLILGLGSVWRVLEVLQEPRTTRLRQPLIAHGALLAMVLWLLVSANSITSLSCFLLTSCVMAITSFSASTRSHLHLLVSAVLCLCIYALFLNPGGGLVESLGRDPTLTGRTEIWQAALRFTTDPLLGTGFESFWLGDRLEKLRSIFQNNPLMEVHNGYLEVFLNLGWIGVILVAVVIVTGYRKVVDAIHQGRHEAILGLGYALAAVVYNFTEAAFKELNPVWIAFLLGTISIPKNPVPEGLFLGIDHSNDSAERPAQVDELGCIGSQRAIISIV